MVVKTLLLAGMACLALARSAAAQPGPDVDRPLVAGDWLTACDATRKCGAYSLPEAEPLETPADLFVRVTRDYAPGSETLLRLELKDEYGPFPDNAEVRVLIDGQESLDRRRLDSGALSLQGTEAVTLLTQMHGGLRLSVEDSEGGLLASASLAGLQEVLARMDMKQRRDGTGDALFLRGPAIADWSRVGLFTPRPVIRVADRRALARPATPEPGLVARLRAGVSCPQHQIGRLDEATTLVLMVPECGGYNREGKLALVNEEGDIIPAAFEPFNVAEERNVLTAEPGGEVILTDPYWEDTDGVLVVERKDRAFGDCGDRQEYVWDATEKRFRLLSYASMPTCRGIREFIVTYTAETAIRPSQPPP